MQTVLRSSSGEAEQINRVTNYFFLAAGAILLIVAALTAVVLYRFRQRESWEASGTNISKKWEILMIGVPTALVAIFLYLSIRTMSNIHPSAENISPDVIITAHQWWWEAKYPTANVVTANEIHLPVGRKILLRLLAADVIHDWWVPQLGNKMDMVPTQQNYLWLTIEKPGDYFGICSEFCGDQHANMRIKVVAQTGEAFSQWLQLQQTKVADTFSNGAVLFTSKTCGNCHRIDGIANANGDAGPDLTHIGSRKTLLAGVLENSETNLERWIDNPQTIKPGAHMPDFLLDEKQVKAIATYLYNLK